MKYCPKCRKEMKEELICPVCGVTLIDITNDEENKENEYEAAEIISTMMVTGIL